MNHIVQGGIYSQIDGLACAHDLIDQKIERLYDELEDEALIGIGCQI